MTLAVAVLVATHPAAAQQATGVCTPAAGERPPIIDVHMHAMGTPPDPVMAELDAHNVIAVVLSSLALPRTQDWAARDARFIPSLAFRDASIPVEKVRELVQRRAVVALGELGFAYAGLRPDDPSLEPYFALAEELDVPVAIHMAGGGLPDVPAFRVRLGEPGRSTVVRFGRGRPGCGRTEHRRHHLRDVSHRRTEARDPVRERGSILPSDDAAAHPASSLNRLRNRPSVVKALIDRAFDPVRERADPRVDIHDAVGAGLPVHRRRADASEEDPPVHLDESRASAVAGRPDALERRS